MNGRTAILTTALVLYAPLGSALADIYQYVDESGVIHFTNVGGGKNHKRVTREAAPAPAAAPVRDQSDVDGKSSSLSGIPSSYLDIINQACGKYGVDPSLVHAIVRVESDFNPYALSRKGAMGLMQLMPQTAVDMEVKNSFSPHENIHGGVKYLRYLLDRYEGNVTLALAAYNSGENAVRRWGTIPPFKETQNYVKKILKLYNGTGGRGTFTPRYTIYIGHSDDGSLLLTDNPTAYGNKKLTQKTGKIM